MKRQTGHDLVPQHPRFARQLRRLWRYRILAALSILGHGFITVNVDNDPGGILTYSMAVATGKGLSDLIREEFGLRITFFTMAVLSLADLANIFSEFGGIASGMGI